MKKNDLLGYLIGFLIFVIAIPLLLWWLAGRPTPGGLGFGFFVVFALCGLALSVWSIVCMRRVGKGNPLDVFGRGPGPRTSVLVTEGPYALCRNPMLLGVLIYYFGLLIWLRSLKADIVAVLFFFVMLKQVESEEKRLERDFGKAYREYRDKTKKLIPYVW